MEPFLAIIDGEIVDLAKATLSSNSRGEYFVNGVKVSEGRLSVSALITKTEDEVKKQIQPSISELAKSAAEALKRIASSGFKMVPDAERERRLNICGAPCSHLDSHSRCLHIELKDGTIEKGCGCYMPAKVCYASMKCPQGKW